MLRTYFRLLLSRPESPDLFPETTERGLGKVRIETLADGVFSIAMTLLILELQVPKPAPGEKELLLSRLLPLWPKIASFILSFLTCGVLWFSHVAFMAYVKRADRVMHWLTITYLMVVSAIPFSTAVLGDYHPQPLAVNVYCGNLLLAGIIQLIKYWYVLHNHLYQPPVQDNRFQRMITGRTAVGPVLYLISMIVAWFSADIAMFICASVLVFYIVPGRIDRFFRMNPDE
jgi:uncharacterized membrane protein